MNRGLGPAGSSSRVSRQGGSGDLPLWPLVLVLLAFVVRVWRLDGQSLWYDEGISVALAGRDLGTITRSAAADIHPPLYYYLLHFWLLVAGNTEFAVRWLSTALGTLLVPIMYLLGRRLGSVAVGLLVTLLAALSPILVYYSQETRMYILMAALGVLLAYLVVRLLTNRQPSRWLWLGYLATGILTAYTHYYGLTLLAAVNLYALAIFILVDRRRLVPWLGTNLLIGIAFLPWVALSWEQMRSWPAISQPFDLPTLLNRVFLAFSFGFAPPADALALAVPLFMMAGGIWLIAVDAFSGFRERRHGVLLATFWAATPVVAMYAASLQRPMYNPKLLLGAVPGYLLLLGLGAGGWLQLVQKLLLGRAFRSINTGAWVIKVGAWAINTGAWGMGLLALAFAFAAGLPTAQAGWRQQIDPRLMRDDYRGIVRHINASWREGDAILLNAPGQVEMLAYYHPDLSVVYPLPVQRPPDEAETVAALQEMVSRHRRVWAVLWATQQADPKGIVERWLDIHTYKSLSRWYGGVRLALYTVPGADAAARRSVSERFGSDIVLSGYSLEGEILQPGEVVGITLYWRADSTPVDRYKVFVQLLDAEEYLWGQHDSEPAGGSRPTVSWKPGEQIADRHGIAVPLGTPPGRYDLIAGVYHPITGQRLPVPSDPFSSRVVLGSVVVERPPVPPTIEDLRPQHVLNFPMGDDFQLLGYGVHRYGSDSPELRAGEPLLLVLFWQAQKPPSVDYRLELVLKNARGESFVPWQGEPARGAYPTSRWQAGEIIRDQHRLAANAPGEYTIGVTLQRGDAVVKNVDIGKIVVR